MNDQPNPGSDAAREQGCLCPVIDNGRGKGYLGGVTDDTGATVFVMREDCPLHGGQVLTEEAADAGRN